MAIVTTQVSWFSRIKNSIKGIVWWLLLLVWWVVLLYWNEGRTVMQRSALNEGQSQVVSINALSEENEWKLIHITDKLVSEQDLTYPALNITEPDALRFMVNHEVLQWVEEAKTETSENMGGSQTQTTTYSYKKEWKGSEVDSSRFQWPEAKDYINNYMPLAALSLTESANVDVITIGDFTLSDSLAAMANDYEAYLPTDEMTAMVTSLAKDAVGTGYMVSKKGEYIYISQGTGGDMVNDVRLSFGIMKEQIASIIGKQETSTIAPFYTSNKTDISMVKMGNLSAEQMFQEAHATNETMKWIRRLLGMVMIYIGFSSLFRPIVVLADVVPFIWSIVGAGLGLISFLLTLALWFITIAIAWIRFRPIFAICLIVIAVWSIGAIWYFGKKNKKPMADTTKGSNKQEEPSSEVIEA